MNITFKNIYIIVSFVTINSQARIKS